MREPELAVIEGVRYAIKYSEDIGLWEVELNGKKAFRALEDLPPPLKEAVLMAILHQTTREPYQFLTKQLPNYTLIIFADFIYTIILHNQKGNKWQHQGKRGRTRG